MAIERKSEIFCGIRMKPGEARKLKALAKKLRVTHSEVVRRALETYAKGRI